MKKVSIIIVNWNGLSHLKKCLPTLEKITYPNYEVILVDNASSDGSQEFVKKNFTKIKIIQNKKNLGFSGGNNEGFKKANGDYILLLNNDTTVEKTFVSEMVKKLESDKLIGGVQGKLRSMDYPDRLDSIGAFLTSTGFLYHYRYFQKDLPKYDTEIYLYSAKGACMLFKKKVIDEVGLFDDDFFAYFEETDFCHRVWLAGYTIMYAPKSVIYHKVGGTSNSMNNAFIQYHSFKNRINSYLKNLSSQELIKILPLHLFLCEIAAIGFILKGKPALFLAINKAIFWNIKSIPNTIKKRKRVQQSIRKVKDKNLLSLIKVDPGYSYFLSLFTKSLVGYKDTKVIKNV